MPLNYLIIIAPGDFRIKHTFHVLQQQSEQNSLFNNKIRIINSNNNKTNHNFSLMCYKNTYTTVHIIA